MSETYWLPADDLTFVNSGSGTATSGWSALTREPSLDDGSVSTTGQKLYAYVTTYSGPVSESGGVICLGVQNFVSTTDVDDTPGSYNATLYGTIDGQQQTWPGRDVAIGDQ